MKKTLLLGIVIALGLAACSNESQEATVIERPEQIGEFVDVPLSAQQKAQVPTLNDFALDLTRLMAVENKNFVVSPLSVAFLLGMLDEGAEGETQVEIVRTLGLGNASREDVNKLMAALLGYTSSADEQVTVAYANNVTLNSTKNYLLSESFGNAMKQYYDASLFSLDFTKPEALTTINNWSNKHSNGLIPSIIDKLDENAVMCLLNAIYFKGAWVHPFDNANTSGFPFKNGKGKWTDIKMMNEERTANYSEESNFKALKLPIGNGTYSMTLILPVNEKSVEDILSGLKGKNLLQISFEEHEVDMRIPIFKTESNTDLISLLSRMGIEKVFDINSSQLTRMVTNAENPLYVALMKQKTQLGINEEGTEGSAVTLAELYDGSAGTGTESQTYTFYANHPFVYFISDKDSGAILFMGVFAGEE